MDRFSFDESGKNQMIYQDALKFIGEVKAGISWESFCMSAVRYSDSFIDMLNDKEEVVGLLASTGISREYVHANVRNILERLHFNKENDYYLALALPRNSSEAQIHKRWKDLMLLYHPDRSNDEDAARCAKQVNEAYSVLKNTWKKLEYDRKISKPRGIYFKVRKENRQRHRAQRDFFISPETRRVLQKLIIPSCMAIAVIILLILFLENRPQVYTGSAEVSSRIVMPDNEKQDSPASEKVDKTTDMQDKRPAVGQTRLPENPLAGKLNDETGYKQTGKKASGTERMQADKTTNSPDKKLTGGESDKPSKPQGLSIYNEKMKSDTGSGVIEKIPPGNAESGSIGATAFRQAPDRNSSGDTSSKLLQGSLSARQSDNLSGKPYSAGLNSAARKEEQDDLEREVFRFIARYVQTYEEGDIDRFMNFFSRSVVENSNLHYGEIKKFYKKNFESSRYKYLLKNVKLQKNEDAVIVLGEYTIRKLNDDDKAAKTDGTIRWILGKEDGNFKIVRMDYERR